MQEQDLLGQRYLFAHLRADHVELRRLHPVHPVQEFQLGLPVPGMPVRPALLAALNQVGLLQFFDRLLEGQLPR